MVLIAITFQLGLKKYFRQSEYLFTSYKIVFSVEFFYTYIELFRLLSRKYYLKGIY